MAKRRGFLLLELGAAGVMLMVLFVVSMQMFRATAAQRRALQHRRAALQAADNVMERLCARPWDELTPEHVGKAPLDDEVRAAVPRGRLAIDVEQADENAGEKRIAVEVRWAVEPGEPDRSVRLVAWKYRPTSD
jgi:hypothetical protein